MSPRAAAVRFHSPFADAWDAFLAYRRDLATYHAHLPVVLRHLDRLLVAHAPGAHALTRPLVQAWMDARQPRGDHAPQLLSGRPPVVRVSGTGRPLGVHP